MVLMKSLNGYEVCDQQARDAAAGAQTTADGLEFHYGITSSAAGFYKIKINSTASWMLSFTIRLYQGYKATDILVCGYQYGANYWLEPKATIIASTNETAMDVAFGYDSVNNLWVAVPSGSYTGLTICNINNGYTQVKDWGKKFSVAQMATLTGTTQTKVTAYRPWMRNEVIPIASGGTGATTAAGAVANLKSALVNMIYPVGAVYMSYVATDPASLFGGTWLVMTGVFPYFNSNTSRGGSNIHTLSQNEIPAFSGWQNIRSIGDCFPMESWRSAYSGIMYPTAYSSGAYLTTYIGSEGVFASYGGIGINFGAGWAHNNMPAYQTLYAWRRTA